MGWEKVSVQARVVVDRLEEAAFKLTEPRASVPSSGENGANGCSSRSHDRPSSRSRTLGLDFVFHPVVGQPLSPPVRQESRCPASEAVSKATSTWGAAGRTLAREGNSGNLMTVGT